MRILTLLLATWRRMRAHDVQLLAGSLAFATVISIVPLLAVSLSVFQAYGGLQKLVAQVEPFLLQNFVDASGVHVSDLIDKSVRRIESGVLGFGGSIALLFTSTKLLLDMEVAVHRVWGEEKKPLSIVRLLVYWVFIFAGPLVVAVAIGLISSKDFHLLNQIPRHSIAFAFTFIGLFCVNWYVPARRVHIRPALISAMVTAIGIALAQHFYAQVTIKILRYSKIYGSLASIPIFLLWIQVLWSIFFFGVALCATLEELTTGQPIKAP